MNDNQLIDLTAQLTSDRPTSVEEAEAALAELVRDGYFASRFKALAYAAWTLTRSESLAGGGK